MHTKHKIDIKLVRNIDRIQFQSLEAFSFPVSTLSYIINTIDFSDNSKTSAIFCAPCMVIDSPQKRFVMNM